MPGLPLALQLYTVREALQQDPAAALRAVRAAGYEHVETADLLGQSPEGFRRWLEDAGLAPVAMHFGAEQVLDNPALVAETLRAMGVRYAVVSWMNFDTRDAWIDAARKLDAAGAALRGEGLVLCYHNHAHEFERFGGDAALDLLLANAAPEHLALELDICWANVGGADPLALLRTHAGRVPLIHAKDYRMDDGQFSFAEVGRGITDWPPILDAAANAGAAWCIVEQDESRVGAMESARLSAEFLAALGQ